MPIEVLSHVRVIENYAFIAPLMFIGVHVLRPFLFIPVLLLCIVGGVMFGLLAGTVYSVVGLMISSVLFYQIIRFLPVIEKRCRKLEEKLLGKQLSLNTPQLMLLRLLPFIHFHLLSFCIYKKSVSFTSYLRTTFFTVLPVASFYTVLGTTVQEMSIYYAIPLVILVLVLAYVMRRKQAVIKWHTFFQQKAV
ncbi:VTT domain-containing protein [Gracilibacillus sp. S3-1-1]|uniref:VTT domain-containing protein n=1 Tax=Gracilibacillus pellucidus TaxID=3095368 RepID=A0ACC6M6Y4_9BACI|nr:VTT domain-containing protein [Gracilibacillus sp. S3-1-1]MDX8046658.1 VTT domain-containing protein [Gracilibacillus sp. S3-1-1]